MMRILRRETAAPLSRNRVGLAIVLCCGWLACRGIGAHQPPFPGADCATPAERCTIIPEDGGVSAVTVAVDAGAGCAQLVPALRALENDYALIAGSGRDCPEPVIDGQGTVAFGTGGVYPFGEYEIAQPRPFPTVLTAPFVSGMDPPGPHGEPSGFGGLHRTGDGISVLRLNEAGKDAGVTQLAGNYIQLLPLALPSGAYSIFEIDDGGVQTWQTLEPDGGISDSVILQKGLPTTPGEAVMKGAVDGSGNVFLATFTSGGNAPCSTRWYSPGGTPLGPCTLLTGFAEVVGGIEGVALRNAHPVDPPYSYSWSPDPSSGSNGPPDPSTIFGFRVQSLSGDRGYVTSGQICTYAGCFGDASTIHLVTPDGKECASIRFRAFADGGTPIFTVGREGTLIEQDGCRYRWWPGVFR